MSIPRTRPLLLAGLVASLTLALPASALAGGSLSPGVHVDPGSPAAKEYALPLATARGAPADTGSTGALFGKGITTSAPPPAPAPAEPVDTAPSAPPDTSTSTVTTASIRRSPTAGSGSRHRGRHRGDTSRTSPAPAATPTIRSTGHTTAPAATRILHPGPGQGWLLMLVAGGAVLGLGGGGAFLIQRRQRAPRSTLS